MAAIIIALSLSACVRRRRVRTHGDIRPTHTPHTHQHTRRTPLGRCEAAAAGCCVWRVPPNTRRCRGLQLVLRRELRRICVCARLCVRDAAVRVHMISLSRSRTLRSTNAGSTAHPRTKLSIVRAVEWMFVHRLRLGHTRTTLGTGRQRASLPHLSHDRRLGECACACVSRFTLSRCTDCLICDHTKKKQQRRYVSECHYMHASTPSLSSLSSPSSTLCSCNRYTLDGRVMCIALHYKCNLCDRYD